HDWNITHPAYVVNSRPSIFMLLFPLASTHRMIQIERFLIPENRCDDAYCLSAHECRPFPFGCTLQLLLTFSRFTLWCCSRATYSRICFLILLGAQPKHSQIGTKPRQ